MNRTMIAALVLGATSLPAAARTAGDVTLHGLIDTTIRYGMHENAAGNSNLQMMDDVLTDSRWGLRGTEDLGGGIKVMFTLESDFFPDTGGSQQGGRLFRRATVVGLEGDYGKLYPGRQYALAHEVLSSYEAMAFVNNSIVGYQGGNYTGLRYDNMVKYIKSFGGLQLAGAWTFGETAGSFSRSSAGAGSIVYNMGSAEVGVMYQVACDVSSTFFGAVPAALVSKQMVWGFGGKFDTSIATWYLGYTSSHLDVADYKNQTGYVDAKVSISSALSFIGTVQYNWMKHLDASGKCLTTVGMLDYAFNKRTDVYAEVNYIRPQGARVALNSVAVFNNSGNTYGNNSRLGVMLSVRYKF